VIALVGVAATCPSRRRPHHDRLRSPPAQLRCSSAAATGSARARRPGVAERSRHSRSAGLLRTPRDGGVGRAASPIMVVRTGHGQLDTAQVQSITRLLYDLVSSGAALGWVDPPSAAEVRDLLTDVLGGVDDDDSAWSWPGCRGSRSGSATGGATPGPRTVPMRMWRRWRSIRLTRAVGWAGR
jgi:hypothetical protein